MECVSVNEREVRILVSHREREQWRKRLKEFHCTGEEKRRWLREILRVAEEQTGRKCSRRMVVEWFDTEDGGCELRVSGWQRREEGEAWYLFDSLDAWLCFYSLLTDGEKKYWGEGLSLPSGRWAARGLLSSEKTEGIVWEFATPLPGEYQSAFLSEHNEEL